MSPTTTHGYRNYVPFTDEQKLAANSVDLVDFLRGMGEPLKRSGREYVWQNHPGITVCGNRWFDHYAQRGGYPVKFLQEYFNLDYVDAVTRLSGGNMPLTPVEFTPPQKQQDKRFVLPEKNGDMRHVFAYLIKQRFINREVISHFAKTKALYEDARHNAVFVGFDENGEARNAHKKGTNPNVSYRVNVAGSDNRYGFGHIGTSDRLYVFEAPIDLLSFLTLYPSGWQRHSFVALDGVAEHAMLQTLEQHPELQQVFLCLDHDAAGIEACGRLTDILRGKGYTDIYRLSPELKDWNEMLKQKNGMEAIPASDHPKIEGMRELCGLLAAEQPDSIRPCKKLFELCGRYLENHNPELLYPAAREATSCAMEQYEKAGKPVSCQQIADHMNKSYRPHMDRGSIKTRNETMDTILSDLKQNMSPSGTYTVKQRMEFARTFLHLGQLCLTTKLLYNQQTPVQKQEPQRLAI